MGREITICEKYCRLERPLALCTGHFDSYSSYKVCKSSYIFVDGNNKNRLLKCVEAPVVNAQQP